MTGSAHTDKFIYQLGEWGPIAEMTDMRYKEEESSYWLWQKTDGHCEACTDFGDWFPTLEVGYAAAADFGSEEEEEYAAMDGVEVVSVYHCDVDCQANMTQPTYGMYAYFECASAE